MRRGYSDGNVLYAFSFGGHSSAIMDIKYAHNKCLLGKHMDKSVNESVDLFTSQLSFLFVS